MNRVLSFSERIRCSAVRDVQCRPPIEACVAGRRRDGAGDAAAALAGGKPQQKGERKMQSRTVMWRRAAVKSEPTSAVLPDCYENAAAKPRDRNSGSGACAAPPPSGEWNTCTVEAESFATAGLSKPCRRTGPMPITLEVMARRSLRLLAHRLGWRSERRDSSSVPWPLICGLPARSSTAAVFSVSSILYARPGAGLHRG